MVRRCVELTILNTDPLRNPAGYMRWKQQQFGIKGTPIELWNEAKMPPSAISCSRDATVWVNGGFFICRDCYEKLNCKQSIYAKFTLTPTPNTCAFCGRQVYAAFYVYKIALTLGELWGILGKKGSRYLKVDGDKIVRGARWRKGSRNKSKVYYI